MLAMPGVRTFSLSPGRDSNGVSCDTNGAFVAGISLLKSAHLDARTSDWIVRPVAQSFRAPLARSVWGRVNRYMPLGITI